MVASRRYVDLLDPRPEDVDIDDLARGLEQPRYRSQVHVPVTIADHLLRCARFGLVFGEPLKVILALLLHDVAEAYLGDMPGPLKKHIKVELKSGTLVGWRELESMWTEAICRALLPEAVALEVAEMIDAKRGPVAEYDHLALRVEALLWMPGAADWADRDDTPVLDQRLWPAAILHDGDEPDTSLCWHAAVEMICEPIREAEAENTSCDFTRERYDRALVVAMERARAYLG